MPSSDGSGQVWGALQTFGYQLISGGGGLMNAACLHHRHRRHSLCCSLHHGPPSPAIVHVPSARSLPLLVARLHALPSLCLPPASLTHTHPPSLSHNPLYTTTYLLASLCPFGLCPCPFCISFKAPGPSQRPWWPQSNGSRWFSRWNGARAEPPPRSGGRSSETRSGRLERRGVEGSGEPTELFGVEQRDQSLDSCLFFSTVLVGGEPPVAVHRASSRLS